jgi:hypothetical protein
LRRKNWILIFFTYGKKKKKKKKKNKKHKKKKEALSVVKSGTPDFLLGRFIDG